MRAFVLPLLLSVASTCLGQGAADSSGCQVSDASRALCAADARLTDALRRNDAAVLSELYPDDFHLVNYRGAVLDKPRVLGAVRAGALRFDSLRVSELRVRVYGTTGVVSGLQHQVAREPGADTSAHPSDVRLIHVYALSDERWRLVATQITPIRRAP